jgi:hypothetical protein
MLNEVAAATDDECAASDAGPISCRLEQIVDAISGFDPASFLGALAATVLGAVVALAGAWWLARRESRERYEIRLDETLVEVVRQADLYDQHLERFTIEVSQQLNGPEGGPLPPDYAGRTDVQRPPAAGLESAMRVARMLARGSEDVHALKSMEAAYKAIISREGQRHNRGYLYEAADVLQSWRTGEIDRNEFKNRMKTIELNR